MELQPQELLLQVQTQLVWGCLLKEASPQLNLAAQELQYLGNLLQARVQLVNLRVDRFLEAISVPRPVQQELNQQVRLALSKRLCNLQKPSQPQPPQVICSAKEVLAPPSLAPCLVASRLDKHRLQVAALERPRSTLTWAARYLVKQVRNLELLHPPIHSDSPLSRLDPYSQQHPLLALAHFSHKQASQLALQVSALASPPSLPSLP